MHGRRRAVIGGLAMTILFCSPVPGQEDTAGRSYDATKREQVSKPRPPADAIIRALAPRHTLRAISVEEIAQRKVSSKTALGQNRGVAREALAGRWMANPEGKWVWTMSLRSEGAEAVRLHFSDFQIGIGSVWVHDGAPETGRVLGPFSAGGPFGDGDFWTELVGGDAVWIEFLPGDAQAEGAPPFRVPELFHLWQSAASANPRTAVNVSCFLDETCYDGNENVGKFSKAVAFLLFSDHTCSGTLINDRNSTRTPYFLTAGHCVLNDSDARTMLAVFGYKTTACNGLPKDLSSYPQVSGSTLLARSVNLGPNGSIILDQPDYALVRLTGFPNTSSVSMGWAFSPSSSDRLTSVSHPRGLTQRLATGNIINSSDPNFFTINIYQGAVDHGSSGSGLVNDSGQLVGADSYSSNGDAVSACDITERAVGYTKFSAIYPGIKQYLEGAAPAQPIARVSPVSIDFGSQQSGTASGSQSFTISNVGSGAMTISSISIQGSDGTSFSQTSTCGGTLAAAASCAVSVVFRPTSAGPKSASVRVVNNATSSPETVNLSGTGTATAAVPTVLSQVTSLFNALDSGVCQTPAPISSFPTNTQKVWLYFDATGISSGDVFRVSYYRPDGALYTSFTSTPSFSGYGCFSFSLSVAGFPPASLPGVWTIRTTWNQLSTPLLTRTFTLVTPSGVPSIGVFTASPSSISPGGTSTLFWSVNAATTVSISPGIGTVTSSSSRTVTPSATTTYTLTATNASGSSASSVTVTVGTPAGSRPQINQRGVVTVAAGAEAVSPLALVSIYGQRFTNGVTQTWNGAALTPTLGGVSVTIDGRPAYPLYVSPTFMNVQVPDSTAFGPVNVTVTNSTGASDPVAVPMSTITAEFKGWGATNYVESNRSGPRPAAAPACPNLACPVAPVGVLPFSTPAQPGETISLWGLGFGPGNPTIPAGVIGGAPVRLANQVTVSVGGVQAVVPFGAFLQGVGLYQVNIIVPNLADGEFDVIAVVGGVRTLKPMKLAIKR